MQFEKLKNYLYFFKIDYNAISAISFPEIDSE